MDLGYELDWQVLLRHAPELWAGIRTTIIVSLGGLFGGSIVGLTGGIVRSQRLRGLNDLVVLYVATIRYTPILVLIYLIYYGLPGMGLTLPVFQAGLIALVLWGGAYNTENFRAAFEAVAPGDVVAAKALGMRRSQIVAYVIVPIGFRIVVPSLINTSVSLLKNSAYLSAIGLAELTYTGQAIVAWEFRVFEIFAVIGVTYLGLVLALSLLARRFHTYINRFGVVSA